MWKELSIEDRILFMNDHIFGKMITFDEILECAKIIGDDKEANQLAAEFVIESNKIENIFHKVLRVTRQLHKEHNH